jgi:hypothetical protein
MGGEEDQTVLTAGPAYRIRMDIHALPENDDGPDRGKYFGSFGKKNLNYPRTGNDPMASLRRLRSDEDAYALECDEVVLDYVHDTIGTDP